MATPSEPTGAPGSEADRKPVSAGNNRRPPGSERRQHDRHAMRVEATVGIEGGPSRACQIQDFCPGGLFLAVEGANGSGIVLGEKSLERDDELIVRFSAQIGGALKNFQVNVLVARVVAGGMGVAFEGRNGAAIHALNTFLMDGHQAKLQDAATAVRPEGAADDVIGAADASSILTAYRRRVVTFLESNLVALFEQARDSLFEAARDVREREGQSKLFGAIQELDSLKDSVQTAFLETINSQLGQPGERPPGADGLISDPESVDLALVDTGTFDDWVVVKDIIARAAPKYAERQQAIAMRLSELMNTTIEDDNNPVGLSSVGLTFHDAMQNLGASHACRQAILRGFEQTVVAGLGTLYDDLTDILSNREVSSDVERTIVERSLGDALEHEKRAEQAPPAPDEQPGEQPGEPDSAHAEQKKPSSVLGIDPTTVTPPTVVVGDLLHTARSLLMLERQAKLSDNLPAALTDMAGAQPLPAPAIASNSLDRVIEALSILQRSPKFTAAGENGPLALKERLVTTWRAAGLRVADGEGDAVEVISNLLDAILDDPLVTPRVKSCVRRLAIALVKVALQDHEFFRDENHPARRLINHLGRVELAADGRVIANGAWQTTIDPVVDRIVHGYEKDPVVFQQVLADLEKVVERQERHLSERVVKIVQERSQQQAALDSRRGSDESREGASASTDGGDVPTEWKRWLKRVQLLQTGDIVFLDNNTDRPAKMHLAWISERHDSYLFASECGEKTSTLTQQELAMHFRRGSARVLDDSALPVVDRGMYRLLNALHARLAKKASRDGVTGTLNGKAFEAALGQAATESVRMGTNHVLCVLEIDDFRSIVAKCGRKAGTGLLRKLARVLEKHVGKRGAIGHLSKGRFAVLLNGCDLDTGRSIVDRQRRSMEKSRCVWQGESIQLTISAGMLSLDERTEASPDELIDAANAAMEKAHGAGGNRIEVGELDKPEPAGPGPTVLQMLAENRLQLRCQRLAPIGADPKAKPYFELLLGIMDDNGNVVMPREFIRAAERNDEMHEVDRWVIRNALDWMAKHRSKVDAVGGYSINLSGLTLGDDNILRYVLDRLAETQVPPSKVIFEVTESAAIDTLSVAVNFINTLKDYGCRFALDDFGTGDASFSYLKTLPIDFVKIDGSIVKDIVDSPKDLALVKSINEIGHFLGKKTVAEFVENDDVLARLRQLGVDYAQGYGIEPPFVLA